jgi:hypothetical protein
LARRVHLGEMFCSGRESENEHNNGSRATGEVACEPLLFCLGEVVLLL